MALLQKTLSGWGRYPLETCWLARPERYAELVPEGGSVIARGQGRSYGDAALNRDGRVLLTERVNRFLAFDTQRGLLRAEAGTTLAEILEVIVPRGWFLPVTPGTKFVSLGGCVAADVHGKNHHHDGSFGQHVRALELILADGSRVSCSPEENATLFWATVGGMGLTGIIGEVTLQLIPIESAAMQVRHHAARDLAELFALMSDPEQDDRYSVAWIDSMARGRELGRGVAMFGHHARHHELPGSYRPPARRGAPRKLPFDFPGWVLNPYSIRAFNALYEWHAGSKRAPFLCDYDPYFYPLDAIGNWNRMYGKRGFLQYQCVLPEEGALEGMRTLLEKLSGSGRPSFLAVLKRLGPASPGMLSFPLAGWTLALDLPLTDRSLFTLLDELDQIVLQQGGRVYLAKDARLAAVSFRAMYPRHGAWLEVKRGIDPENRFGSSLARRLKLVEAAP